MEIPKVIHYFITGRCNLGCKFCYGKFNNDILDLGQKKEIIEKIAGSGVRKLTVSGGEPLVDPDTLEIIEFARSKELFVSLHTNGILLTEDYITKLKGNVGRVSLAIEGPDNEVNLRMRGVDNYFNLVEEKIKLLKKYDIRYSIKTVASAKNIDQIPELVNFLTKYPPDVWLISQFRPKGRGKKHKDEFAISNSEFNELVDSLKSAPLNISFRSISERDSFPMFFTDSNGDVFTGDGFKVIGSIFKEDIPTLWQEIITKCPITDTYIQKTKI